MSIMCKKKSSLWEKFKTTVFIGHGAIHSVFSSENHRFKDIERERFHSYLQGLNPVDPQSRAWRFHLMSANIHSDVNNVALLQRERVELEQTYRIGETTVHQAMSREETIFGENANQYPEGSLNRNLREHRPPTAFMPNGNIRFK